MFKGVEPMVAAILLVLIAVGLSAMVYNNMLILTQEIQNKTEGREKGIFDLMGVKLKIDTFGDCKIYLRNIGDKEIPLKVVDFYIADINSDNFRLVKYNTSVDTIKRFESAEITFSGLPPNKYKLSVKIYDQIMDFGFLTCGEYIPVSFCSIKTSCSSDETKIVALSDTTNAFVELPSEGNYPYFLCCPDIHEVSYKNSICNLQYVGLFALSTNSTFEQNTNAYIEKYNYTDTNGFDYKKNVCVVFDENLNCTYDTLSDCDSQGYDKYIVSLSGETNAKLGKPSEYSLVLCCK